jgi:dTDP-N-acetylfucosamine:lipid II N-acetylfucosaminyltransferase
MIEKKRVLSVYSDLCGSASKIDLMRLFLDYCKESKAFDESMVNHTVLVESEESFVRAHSFPRDSNILICENLDDFTGSFMRLSEKSDTIIFHSYPHRLIQKLCSGHKKLLKRCIWYTWGGDFKRTKDSRSQYWRRVIRRRKSIAEKFVQNIHGVACWNRADLKLIKDVYRSHAKMYLAQYTGETEVSEVCRLKIAKPTTPIRCLVGNNANPSNNHMMLLDALSKFKNEDIEVYVPLSYASTDQDYIDRVCELGSRLFGSKFIPLTDYMDKLEYTKLLHTMSMGVFYQNRQQGGYNMLQLLMSGAKLYLNPQSATAKHFKETGITTFDSKKITKLSFDHFFALSDEIATDNRKTLKHECSLEYNDAQWSKIINRA